MSEFWYGFVVGLIIVPFGTMFLLMILGLGSNVDGL